MYSEEKHRVQQERHGALLQQSRLILQESASAIRISQKTIAGTRGNMAFSHWLQRNHQRLRRDP